MADPKFPYVQWRDGRPRAVHGPKQRKRGFRDEDLKHKDGRWYTMEECGTWSDVRVAEVKLSRAKRFQPPPKADKAGHTVADLLADWKAAWPAVMAQTTRVSHQKGINAILYAPEAPEPRKARRAAERRGIAVPRQAEYISQLSPFALGKPELRAFHNHLLNRRGAHMARAVIATLSAALTWSTESTKWRLPSNPRLDMDFEQPDGRVVLVTMPEFTTLVAAADLYGRPSIGDCCYLGLFTGQRQTDRLAMKDESEGDGRHAFRQSKTGMLVDIKEAPQLADRLDAARARVAAIKLAKGTRPETIVVNEENGLPYAAKTYGKHFENVRAIAIAGLHDGEAIEAAIARGKAIITTAETPIGDNRPWRLAPCPALIFLNERGERDVKHDQDLRDTCVMLLDRAGCDLLTICDITGHSYASAQTIIKHYRARNADRADTGIDRLVLQVRKEGLAG